MVVTIIVSIIVCLLSRLAYLTKKTEYLGYSFFILFLYLAFRYDFGNDYMSYYELFYSIKETPWSEISTLFTINSFGEVMEPGYLFLNKLFSTFSNFYLFIAFQSLLFCLVYYNLIKKYVPPKYYWLSLVILMLDTSLMVRSISGLRQSFAVFCFIYSIKYLVNRQVLKYILLIFTACLFHYSALILLPLYFVINHRKISKAEPFIYMICYLALIFFGTILISPVQKIVEQLFPKYLVYFDFEAASLSTGLGLAISSIVYVAGLFTANTKSNTERIFYRLFALFIIFSPLSLYIHHASRLNLYLAPSLIVFIPQLLNSKQHKQTNFFLVCLFIAFTIYGAYGHYTSPIYSEKNYNYKSILSQKQ